LHFANIRRGSNIRILSMSVSSIPASPPAPISYTDASTPAQVPSATADDDSSDAGTSQPVQPPLPPGQGTRVNQLV
jgi:hypothetical protein